MGFGGPPLEDEIDLRKYFEIIWRRKNLLVTVTVVAVGASLAWSLATPRKWQAVATVMVPEPPKTEQAQVVGGVQATSPAVVYSQATYARLLKSTVLIEKATKKLTLAVSPDEISRRISAKPIRDTRLIEVAARGSSPEEATALANAIAEALIEYDQEVIGAELTQARKFVRSQLDIANEELQAKEEALKIFAQRENLPGLEAEVNRRLQRLTSLRASYEQNTLDLGVASRRLAQVRQELAATSALRLGERGTQANTLGPSLAANLRAKLADLETQRAALLEKYTSSHPSVVTIDAQVRRTEEELTAALGREPQSEMFQANSIREQLEAQQASGEIDIAGLQTKDRMLSEAIRREDATFNTLSARLVEKRAELNRLTREAEVAKSVYATLSAKATEAVVAEGMKTGFVRVVDRAAARPVARGTVTKAALAGLLGLMGGMMLLFALEFFTVPPPVPAMRAATPTATMSGSGHPSSRPGTASHL